MDWIKKNWPFLIIALLLIVGAWGICFAGQRISEAKAAVNDLTESLRKRDKLISEYGNELVNLGASEEKLRSELRELQDIVRQRQANDREALRIIESASHR